MLSLITAIAVAACPYPGNQANLRGADTIDGINDLSGAFYRQHTVDELVLVKNDPGTLYRMRNLYDDDWTWSWEGDTHAWRLAYGPSWDPDCTAPDAEAVTMVDPASTVVYVSSERCNGGISTHKYILKYDFDQPTQTVLHDSGRWQLADTDSYWDDHPNGGGEGLTYVPDSWWTERGWVANRLPGRPEWDPEIHGFEDREAPGLFVVALEGYYNCNDGIYVFDLSAADDEADDSSEVFEDRWLGHIAVGSFCNAVGLEYDPVAEVIWLLCDNNQRIHAIDVNENGALQVTQSYPAGKEGNIEGLAISPEDVGTDGTRPYVLTRDHGAAVPAVFADFEFGITEPLAVTASASYKDHGGIVHGVPSSRLEPRLGGISDLRFDVSWCVDDVAVDLDCASFCGDPSINYLNDGFTVQLDFGTNGITSTDWCDIELSGSVRHEVTVGALEGDVNDTGNVNTVDASAVKVRCGLEIDGYDYPYDLNADGFITSVDFSAVKARYGHSMDTQDGYDPICAPR